MIVVLSKSEYASSHWVQYEWDSFYNDYLSEVRKEANLFTLTSNVNIHELPRTLRNVQNFDYKDGISHICDYIKNAISKQISTAQSTDTSAHPKEKRISIITGKQVTAQDIADAVTKNGEKFCKLFGMTKIKNSSHDSSLYEITMIPPKFRILSKKSKLLYDYYQRKYNDAPYLFLQD